MTTPCRLLAFKATNHHIPDHFREYARHMAYNAITSIFGSGPSKERIMECVRRMERFVFDKMESSDDYIPDMQKMVLNVCKKMLDVREQKLRASLHKALKNISESRERTLRTSLKNVVRNISRKCHKSRRGSSSCARARIYTPKNRTTQ